MEQSFNSLCRQFYENALFTNQILLQLAQNQTEMMNSLSIIKRTVEKIVGVEGGINVTGVGAMEEESSGLGEENRSVAGGIGNWSLGLGRVVGGATNTSAFGEIGDGWRAMGGVTNSSTSMGDGSLGLGRAVGGITDTSIYLHGNGVWASGVWQGSGRTYKHFYIHENGGWVSWFGQGNGRGDQFCWVSGLE